MIYERWRSALMFISLILIGHIQAQVSLQGNLSVLPAGWAGSASSDCISGEGDDLELLGPQFFDPVSLTVESCVSFCDQQGQRMAGLKGSQCLCSIVFNPSPGRGFGSDGAQSCNEFGVACPGNFRESCGIPNDATNVEPDFYKVFFKTFGFGPFACFIAEAPWPGGAALTAVGSWRFSYFYNDSTSARALPHNAVNLPVPLPRGNLTTEACVTACGNAGFLLAGVEFADECYCGNALQNGAQQITDCSLVPTEEFGSSGTLMRCKGNPNEFCGGPNLVSIYTLPGTGLVPIIPFNSSLDDLCSATDCPGSE